MTTENGIVDAEPDPVGTPADGTPRGHFGTKLGFVLAAAGSAVGLGNIWKFPYIAGDNGGGAFVLIYLVCIAVIGLPIMIGEIMLGRMTQKAPVGALGQIAGRHSPWKLVGGMGVLAAFFMLSFYSVVAGWALHYTWISCVGLLQSTPTAEIPALFGQLYGNPTHNFTWHLIFMGLTTVVVLGGIQKGIERWSMILMPLLLGLLGVMLWQATESAGWDRAVDFVFGFHTEQLTHEGILEALGHSFFTLSLGMGAMITYGSYLRRDAGLYGNAVAISIMDTAIALMACLILFPITFSYGMEPSAGPGLVFQNIPVALTQMPYGQWLCIGFFALLVFAALTSAMSLLEVVASYFIDQWKMARYFAVMLCASAITIFGIPSALSGSISLFSTDFAAAKAEIVGEEWGEITKPNWFDFLDYLVSNWMLPLGGLFIAIFCAWRVEAKVREAEFMKKGVLGATYAGWLFLLKWIIPVVVIIVCLHAAKLFKVWGVEAWLEKTFG